MSGLPDGSVHIGPLQLKNPVMHASGTFGYAEEYASFMDLNLLGAIVVKTITLKPRVGSYPHRSAEVDSGLLASIGLQNVGIERFIEDKLDIVWRNATSGNLVVWHMDLAANRTGGGFTSPTAPTDALRLDGGRPALAPPGPAPGLKLPRADAIVPRLLRSSGPSWAEGRQELSAAGSDPAP